MSRHTDRRHLRVRPGMDEVGDRVSIRVSPHEMPPEAADVEWGVTSVDNETGVEPERPIRWDWIVVVAAGAFGLLYGLLG